MDMDNEQRNKLYYNKYHLQTLESLYAANFRRTTIAMFKEIKSS